MSTRLQSIPHDIRATGYSAPMFAFIGCGRLAEAVVRGALSRGVLSAGGFMVTSRRSERTDEFARLGWQVASNREAAAAADVLVLGVRYQDLGPLLFELAGTLEGRVLVSLAVGLPSAAIEAAAPGARVVRVITNTPAAIGQGVTVLSPGRSASPGDLDEVERLFSAVGQVIRAPEPALNAWNALVGVGPALVYELARALGRAAESAGLPPEAGRMAAQATIQGAARLMEGQEPGLLSARVAGPGGSTRAALDCLEAAGFDRHIAAAFAAAVERAGKRDSESVPAERHQDRPISICHDALCRSGVPFRLHGPEVEVAAGATAPSLPFDQARIVKTVAFGARNRTVLVATQLFRRVDYALLAATLGVKRRELDALSAEQVRALLRVEPGSVSPVPGVDGVLVLLDADVMGIEPTIFCGIGRPGLTLEIAPADLARATGAEAVVLSRPSLSR